MKEDNSHLHTLSVLPQLKMLDFKVVTEKDLEDAFEKFPIKLKKHNLNDLSSLLNLDHGGKSGMQFGVDSYPEDAYVDGLVGDSGFRNLIESDKNFAILHSFPPVWKIALEHRNQINAVFNDWHGISASNYEKMCEERPDFLEMVKEVETQTLTIAREEEEKYINMREEVPRQLCLIYQKQEAQLEEDEIIQLKDYCLSQLHTSVEKLLNAQCMKVNLLLHISSTFKETMAEMHDKYLKDVVECCNRIIVIDCKCVSELKQFYFNLPSEAKEWNTIEDQNGDLVSINPAIKRLLQNKELIETILELAPKIHYLLLEQKVKNLLTNLNQDVKKILDEVIKERAYGNQNAEMRNIVLFYNEQKIYIDKLFLKSNSFRHFLGYR